MKFYNSPFAIDKKYADELRRKETAFREQTKTRKQIFNTLITTFELIPNEHSIGLIDSVVTMDDLFVGMEGK
jgi:hypothetical protein